jgi:predicted Rossmann-fold nucleotide-binding protein
VIEIDDLEQCRDWLSLGERRPPAAFQSLDLRHLAGFESGSFAGCLFLACELTPAQAGFLTTMGATVIRDRDVRPFTAHRAQLYTPEELFAGFDPDDPTGYESTYDAAVYRHWERTGRQYPPLIDESLARRLHDHSISDALHDELVGHRPVAVMGGHSLERADPQYACVARIARGLTRSGRLMLSGGGPGAMEATHLGAWMANFDDAELDRALTVLAPRPTGSEPGKEYADPDWLHRAFEVRRRWPLCDIDGGDRYDSIGIPTWMYGHEPPAAFATKIAKYFANSIREEGLLAVATHGVVFTPGSAGTIQEIFQDAAQNHYESFGPAAPMVLVGIDYWTSHRPVWPLLESLAEGYQYRHLITLTDDEDEVVDRILAYDR